MATMFLKFEPELEGESTQDGFQKTIEVDSYSHSVVHAVQASKSGVGSLSGGSCSHSAINIAKRMDKTSPVLMLRASDGKRFDKATLTILRANSDGKLLPYMEILLEHVIVADYQQSGITDGVPSENISLGYGKISMTYKASDVPGKASGNLVKFWDLTVAKGSDS
jgi:type VI secretion system secreted protein Hcp